MCKGLLALNAKLQPKMPCDGSKIGAYLSVLIHLSLKFFLLA